MTGLKAFALIFLMMPLGHALMILMNKYMGDSLIFGAVLLFVLGFAVLVPTRFTRSTSWQSFLGALSGVLMWTGAVEYSLYFGAQAMGVERVGGTAAEYRVMMHTWGFVLMMMIYLILHEGVRCSAFIWLRKKLRLTHGVSISGCVTNFGPRTAFEMISILWFFYVLLLVLYDTPWLGEHSPATYATLVLSLAGSVWMLYRLARVREMGYAIRYAIPTVIIAWNCVEILARWEVFTEPWIVINPPIMLAIVGAFVFGLVVVVRDLRRAPTRLRVG